MTERSAVPSMPAGDTPPLDRRVAIAGAVVLVAFVVLAAGLLALVLMARAGNLPGAAGGQARPAAFAYPDVAPAPPLELTNQDGQPFTLASLKGRPVLVFFGYTHCPDVCPANVGVINQALADTVSGPRVVFVTIDPERDDVPAMKSYLRYLPAVYTGLTGSPDEIRRNADAWSVKYAKIDQNAGDAYAMAHTADIFLVDAQGRLRAHFPFGTEASSIASSLAQLLAETPPPTDAPPTPVPAATSHPAAGATALPVGGPGGTPAPTTPPAAAATVSPGTAPMGELRVTVISTSIWAGGASPLAMTITDGMGMALDGTTPVVARVIGNDGNPVGSDAPAVAIRPTGEAQVSFVATVDIPSPGRWRIDLVAANGSSGSIQVDALDPGNTARLGAPAPDIHTPTLADVGGNLLAISTLPQADSRFYQASTSDARAAGRPYVLVIDSARFKVTQVCGRALGMAFYLLDRWTDVTFVHLEPFEYQIITGEPVLSGDISNPPLDANARAFGLGDSTWPATNMPWLFVVDGNGIVRAKYNGIVGSNDVDLILSLITGEGVLAG